MDPAELYKPPKADLDAAAPVAEGGGPPRTPLYSVPQITTATFFGGPLAGALLMAGNARATGRVDSARNCVLGGVGATIAFVILAMVLPKQFPGFVLSIACVLSLQSAARSLQGPWLREHFLAGGFKRSNWRVAGISVACLAGLVLVLFAAAVLFQGARALTS